jgi:hypothetical protein
MGVFEKDSIIDELVERVPRDWQPKVRVALCHLADSKLSAVRELATAMMAIGYIIGCKAIVPANKESFWKTPTMLIAIAISIVCNIVFCVLLTYNSNIKIKAPPDVAVSCYNNHVYIGISKARGDLKLSKQSTGYYQIEVTKEKESQSADQQ